MEYRELPAEVPQCEWGPNGIVWMRCECCELLTLALVEHPETHEVDWESTSLLCSLCGWQSIFPLNDGDGSKLSPEERNEGQPLASAKANFERFGWMYDPANPPEWYGGPAYPEELEVRHALRDAYRALDAAQSMPARAAAWEQIHALEERMKQVKWARAESFQDEDGEREDDERLP